MKKSNKVVPKKGRGRPATGRDPVTAIRLAEGLREKLETWAAQQPDKPGRSEAIRRLVELGLGQTKDRDGPASQTLERGSETIDALTRDLREAQEARSAARAAELAAKAIDGKIDPKVPAEDRAVRKRKLLKAPSDFRDSRKDRAR